MVADAELARRCGSGDESAWAMLVERYQRRIWHVAYQFTGRADEAEELAQEIFMHLLGALGSFDPEGSLTAWINRVARNFAIDHYRRRRRERSLVTAGEDYDNAVRATEDPDQSVDPHTALEHKDLSAWLREAIKKLPVELGQAVILRDLEEMSYEDMASQLDVPLGTVKSRINRARVELARRLKRRRSEWSQRFPETASGDPT